MKLIVTINPTNIVANSFSSVSYTALETKKKNQVLTKLMFCFLFIACHALVQSHAKWNRLIKVRLLPCQIIVSFALMEAPFTLKILKFLYWIFGHVEKTAWLER